MSDKKEKEVEKEFEEIHSTEAIYSNSKHISSKNIHKEDIPSENYKKKE